MWVPGRVCGPRTGGPMPLTPGAPTSGSGRRQTSQLEEREDACLRVIVDAHADGRRRPVGRGPASPGHEAGLHGRSPT